MTISRTFIDQLGSSVTVSFPPKRIISLVPSQTELLADLGLDHEVVGITRFCIHPETWIKTKTIIGGTKNFDFERIKALNPHLIIGNKEENYKDGIDVLRAHFPVWMSDIKSLSDAISMIRNVGVVTDREDQSNAIANEVDGKFKTILKKSSKRVLYLIWRKPWMAVGADTFINKMLQLNGWENSLAHTQRYPEITSEEIRGLNPDVIFLSSEPYPFQEKHQLELSAVCPESKILLVDGEMFSWYGSRLLQSPDYFNLVLHPMVI